MFRSHPTVRERYVALDRAAEVLKLKESQLTQYLVTGQLLAAIVYHKPSDFREVRQFLSQDGNFARHTKTSRTELKIVSPDHEENKIMYLEPEDTARVLLNKVPERSMLVSRLFYDRTLQPEKGLGLMGASAIEVSPSELIITSEELDDFARKAKIKIERKTRNEIDFAPRPWYDRPIGRTVLAIIAIVFGGLIMLYFRSEF